MFFTRFFTFAFLLSLFFTSSSFANPPLPQWMTEAEKQIYPNYLNNISETKSTTPPASIPRTPGEYEEAQAVIVTWASYSNELREIVRHASEVVTVYIVCSNISHVQSFLTSGNVSLDNIIFIQAPFNSVWIRDYGPQSIYLAENDQLAFVDWVYNRPRPNDNQIPMVMSNFLELPIYQMTSNPNRLVATGGNFMADGFGTAFSSELILSENSGLNESQIDDIVQNYMGIGRYIKMPELPYDGIHHIDMHMKLINEETLLIGQFPDGVSDGPTIESNLQQVLENYPSVYNRPYKVVRVPMPANQSGNYAPHASYRTYTNSLILNNLVLVPIFGLFPDSEALQIYEHAMPGYNVVGINMESVIGAGGAIHCITREIAANDPILFAHASPDTLPSWQDSYEIKAAITSSSGINKATLHWTTDPLLGLTSQPMALENDTFSIRLPKQECNTEIYYYFSATNNNSKTSTKPLVAPDGSYRLFLDGQGMDFYSDLHQVSIGEKVSFQLCDEGPFDYDWDFGEGAQPPTAEGTGPHEVFFTTSGGKTIALIIDGEIEVVRENYVHVADPDNIILWVETEGQGTTNPKPGTYYYEPGTRVDFSAAAAPGWEFDHWLLIPGEETIETEEFALNLEENTTATAVFRESTVSITTSKPIQSFMVCPNPSNGYLTLSFPPNTAKIEILITNLQGQPVYLQEVSIYGASPLLPLDLSDLASGIYLIRLTDGKESHLQKIILR